MNIRPSYNNKNTVFYIELSDDIGYGVEEYHSYRYYKAPNEYGYKGYSG